MFKLKTAKEAIITQLSGETISFLQYFNDNLINLFSEDNKNFLEIFEISEEEIEIISKNIFLLNKSFCVTPKINNNYEMLLLKKLLELNDYKVIQYQERLVIALI